MSQVTKIILLVLIGAGVIHAQEQKSTPAQQTSDESASEDRVYAGKDVDKKAKMKSSPAPDFSSADSDRPTGTVILKAVFAKTGRVENITVVKGLPNGMTEKCIEAAKKIKFIPAMKDGHKVSMWMQLEYSISPLD